MSSNRCAARERGLNSALAVAFSVQPIGWVRAERASPIDDNWGGARSRIVLDDAVPAESLDGIEAFSHLEILFLFDRVNEDSIVAGARHPRGNTEWPKVGIFAQRGKNRPNRIGSTICRFIERAGRELVVSELDAIDGTPVIDIKPVMQEFLPREPVRQPEWSRELMGDYWRVE